MNTGMSDTHDFLRYVLTDKPNEDATIGPRVRLQQHLDLARAVPLMAMITLFNSMIAVYVVFSMTGEYLIFLWSATNFFAAVLMLFDYFRKAGRPVPKSVSGRYVFRSEVMGIFTGFLFGSMPLYINSDAFSSLILSSLFSVSMCAGLMCVLPRNPRLVVRYLTGASIPLLVHIGLHFSDRMIAIAIGLALLFLTIYFGARAAFKLYLKEVKSVEEATQLREILEVALDGSGQAFAVLSTNGKVVFENELYTQVKPALRNVEALGGVVHAHDRYWQTATYEVASIGSVEIFTDVSRIEDARQEAESLRQEADEASHAKTRFLRSVTSELLVPLRTIRLQASMMDAGSRIPVTKADMNRAADQIRLLTESLEGRVEQIIGYASGDATQADLASTADLREADTNPVLKLETFLRRNLRGGLPS
jgi:signal transduction histidine kinase